MDSSIKFWNRFASRYAKTPVKDQASYQKKLTITQQYLEPDSQVLEFGCGTGSTALIHAPHVANYTATDISPGMIEICQGKLASESINNLDFKVATIEDILKEDTTYDAILGLSILHLVEDKDETIQQVYKLLKPGGVFVSNTACLGDTMGYFRFIAPIGKFLGLIPLVKVFTRKALEESLTKAGFIIDYQWVPESSKLVYFLVAKKP